MCIYIYKVYSDANFSLFSEEIFCHTAQNYSLFSNNIMMKWKERVKQEKTVVIERDRERQAQARAHVAPVFPLGVGRTLIIFTCSAENCLLLPVFSNLPFINPHQSLPQKT
jgi:hypothetical protein